MYFLAGMCANANNFFFFLVLMSITETRIGRRKGAPGLPCTLLVVQDLCSAVFQPGSAPAAVAVGLRTGLRIRYCVLLGTKLSKDREPGDKGKNFSMGEASAGLCGLGGGAKGASGCTGPCCTP